MTDEELRTAAALLEKLKQESITAHRFEEAVVYDNALHQLERRPAPEWPKNRSIG